MINASYLTVLIFPYLDPLTRKKRKQRGGNSGKNFTEGWVEFEDKADAKRIAAMLNGQQMGGKRRSAHYFDLWTIKYLPKFKWDHLTEEINYQKAVREQRLAAEVAAAKRERDFYLSRVDKAKAVESIIERKKRKRENEEEEEDAGPRGRSAVGTATATAAAIVPAMGQKKKKKKGKMSVDTTTTANKSDINNTGPRVVRTYGQRKSKADPVNDADAPMLSRGLLEMIAGKKKKKKER
jgi:ESF2/ABP1 family protein